MKGSMSQLQPPEVRILKHILSIEDPMERRSTLEEAFTPGPEMATEKEDYLSTCAGRESATRIWARCWLFDGSAEDVQTP